ncbi:MAG: hypothetical protein ACM3SU_05645 [Acidobacteriota bacterium]
MNPATADANVLIDGNSIKQISTGKIAADGAKMIDGRADAHAV